MAVPNWFGRMLTRIFAKRTHPLSAKRSTYKLLFDTLESRVVPSTLNIAFGNITASGYVNEPPTLYPNTPAGASAPMGWVGTNAALLAPKLYQAIPVLENVTWAGANNVPRTFEVDGLTPGTTYYVTGTSGQYNGTAGTDMTVAEGTAVGSSSVVMSATTGLFTTGTLLIKPNASGSIQLTFTNSPATTNWVLNTLNVVSASSENPITIARSDGNPLTTPVGADGTTVDTYLGSGAAANQTLTITASGGTITTPDQVSSNVPYTGIQVVANASGNFSFTLRRPLTTTPVTLTAQDVNGGSSTETSTGTQPFVQDYKITSHTLYVGTAAQTPGGTTWNPGSGTSFTSQSGLAIGLNLFNSLQAAINQASSDYTASTGAAIDTIEVAPAAAGTYESDYSITTPMTLLGAQYMVGTPSTHYSNLVAHSSTETYISAPSTTTGSPGSYDDVFRVLASNVTISGFVVDGTGAAAPADGITDYGADSSATAANVSGITVTNNIIQNFSSDGIVLDNANGGSASTGNLVQGNYLTNIQNQGYGGAIWLTNNFYANVMNNTIVGTAGTVGNGNQYNNYGILLYTYSDSGSMTVSGNTVTVGQDSAGIFAEYFSAGSVSLSGNTIQAGSGVTATDGGTWGMGLWGFTGGTATEQNDVIGTGGAGQLARGVTLWNDGTDNVSLSGTTIGASSSIAPAFGIYIDNGELAGNSTSNVVVPITSVTSYGTTYGMAISSIVVPGNYTVSANVTGGSLTGGTAGVDASAAANLTLTNVALTSASGSALLGTGLTGATSLSGVTLTGASSYNSSLTFGSGASLSITGAGGINNFVINSSNVATSFAPANTFKDNNNQIISIPDLDDGSGNLTNFTVIGDDGPDAFTIAPAQTGGPGTPASVYLYGNAADPGPNYVDTLAVETPTSISGATIPNGTASGYALSWYYMKSFASSLATPATGVNLTFGSVPAVGYLNELPTVYGGGANPINDTNTMGWVGANAAYYTQTGSNPALENVTWAGTNGASRTFQIDGLTPGTTYYITATAGQYSGSGVANTTMTVTGGTAVGSSSVNFATTMAGQFADGLLAVQPTSTGSIDLQFSNGTPLVNWTLNTINISPSAPPQLLAGAANTNPHAKPLTEAQLKPIVAAAIKLWTQAGATPAQIALLKSTVVTIGNLSGSLELGEDLAGGIVIDSTADGDGWYIDPTPLTTNGFTRVVGTSEFVAVKGTAASKELDLLTVVMHEMGHILGYGDLDPATNPYSLMSETLGAGIRRLPPKI